MLRSASLLFGLLFTFACGAAPSTSTLGRIRMDALSIDSEEAWEQSVGTIRVLGPQIEDPRPLERALAAYLARETDRIVASNDYDALVEHFERMLEPYAPLAYEERRLDPSLVPVAEAIVRLGSPRGDEALVLSAWRVLATIRPDGGAEREYQALARWTFDARAQFGEADMDFAEYRRVWTRHGELTPAPSVLAKLAAIAATERQEFALPRGFILRNPRPDRSVRELPPFMRVAVVYLAHGDFPRARAAAVEAGVGDSDDLAFLDGLSRDPDPLVYSLHALPPSQTRLAIGLAAFGHRSFPQDARFLLALGVYAATRDRIDESRMWFTRALDVTREEGLLVGIVGTYGSWLQRSLEAEPGGATAATQARRGRVAAHVDQILALHASEYPNAPPLRGTSELLYLLGDRAITDGTIDEARGRLEASIRLEPSVRALTSLAELELKSGRYERARTLARRALDLTPGGQTEISPTGEEIRTDGRRAQILERIADSFRADGDADQAARHYQEALRIWTDESRRAESMDRAFADERRAAMLARLGRGAEARTAYRAALEGGSPSVMFYVRLLSSFVSNPASDDEIALEALRLGLRSTTIEPEWRAYLALWAAIVARRAGHAVDAEITEVLTQVAEGMTWHARLAQHALGRLTIDALLAAASSAGERTEALFYEATSQLFGGDQTRGRALLEQVIALHMFGYYEYEMARELLLSMPTDPASTTPASPRNESVRP